MEEITEEPERIFQRVCALDGLRARLESPEVDTGCVLAIPRLMRIGLAANTTVRADYILKILIASDWAVDSCGQGSTGERRYAWAWVGTRDARRHLLLRRSLIPNEKGVLDHSQVRTYPALLRHLVLTMTALSWSRWRCPTGGSCNGERTPVNLARP